MLIRDVKKNSMRRAGHSAVCVERDEGMMESKWCEEGKSGRQQRLPVLPLGEGQAVVAHSGGWAVP